MSNELIKRAYEKLNGVYPYNSQWAHDAKYSSRTVLAVCTESHKGYLDCKYEEGNLYMVDVSYDKEKWFFITKADFDAYGESLKEEWTPEVGQECEVMFNDDETPQWFSGIFIAISDGRVVFDFGEEIVWPESLDFRFRPPKTEFEKQVDRRSKALDIINSIEEWDVKGETLSCAVDSVFGSGSWEDLKGLIAPVNEGSEKQAEAMFDIVKDATDLYHACELLRDAGYKK